MKTRVCKLCEGKFPLNTFPSAGRQYYRRVCQKCYYKTNTLKQVQRIREWFLSYKKEQKCLDCGLDDFRVLDFHHRNPLEKSFEISTKATGGWGIKTLLKEIEKCDVLCANCHRIHTYEERNNRG